MPVERSYDSTQLYSHNTSADSKSFKKSSGIDERPGRSLKHQEAERSHALPRTGLIVANRLTTRQPRTLRLMR